jgi:hypothetical protein
LVNDGPDAATGVTATFQLPAGLTVGPGASCVVDDAGSVCRIGPTDLPAGSGAGASVEIVGHRAGAYLVTGAISADQPDPVSANDTASATLVVVEPTDADVSLRLPGVFQPVFADQPFFTSVEVGNDGPAGATGVTAVLRLPGGLTVLSGAACAPEEGGSVCTFGPTTLPAGARSVALVQLVATAAGSYRVTGTVAADQPDPDPVDNAASVTIEVAASADVLVDVTESADPSAPSKPLIYTVNVVNLGPSSAQSVTLVDTWTGATSGGVRLVAVDSTQGTCAVGVESVMCDVGLLRSGASATVTVRLRPRGVGTVTNQATVASADDPDTTNDTDTETTRVG